eukprot:9483593-Pyramimonas_sp.AAC.1
MGSAKGRGPARACTARISPNVFGAPSDSFGLGRGPPLVGAGAGPSSSPRGTDDEEPKLSEIYLLLLSFGESV